MTRPNCWEVMNCPEERKSKCEIYKLSLCKECYKYVDGKHVRVRQCIVRCLACPFYKVYGTIDKEIEWDDEKQKEGDLNDAYEENSDGDSNG